MKISMKRALIGACILAGYFSAPVYAQDPSQATDPAVQAPAVQVPAHDPASADPSAQPAEAQAEEPKSIYDNPELKPRDMYNMAFDELGKLQYDTAIEGFGRARDLAAFDNELRYAAAYNLAHALAQKAQSLGDPNTLPEDQLQAVIENLGMSAAWFRDAVRQRPSLQEAKGNLEIVLKRWMHAKDILAQKYNTLEKQLDAAIAAERAIRENTRILSQNIQMANAKRDPIAFQDEFKSIAKNQRELLTQANLIAENLANQLSSIEATPEDQRSPEDAMKGFQLKMAEPLLESARQAMAGSRRQLRDLAMDDALRLTTKAFNQLKQAREQLEDPLAVLQHIAEDQESYVRIASAKLMFDTPELLDKYREQMQQPDIVAPAWLNNDLLEDTQTDTLVRTNRVSAFLKMMVEAAAQQPEQQPQDPQQAQQMEAQKEQMAQIQEALPFIENAASAMQKATQAIEVSDVKETVTHAGEAVNQLALAMERFADLKHLIEIAYASHIQIEPVIRGDVGGEKPEYLSRFAQRQLLAPALATNIERMERLASLLAKEAAKANQQAMQAAQQQGGQEAPTEEQMQQMQQLFEHAEALRQTAKAATQRMADIVTPAAPSADANGQPGILPVVPAEDTPSADAQNPEMIVPTDPAAAVWTELLADAEVAQKSLEDLRILFFTVIEHVKELLKQQTSTLDQTTDVASAPAGELEMKLPPVIDRQRVHELTAEKLAEVLTEQAQQIQQQAQGMQAQGGQDPAEMAKRYTQAASELQVAATAMRQAQTDLQNENHLFTEAIEQQNIAVEHIQKALELLQP
ncbi:MAG: hypothetical protein J6S69_07115, partial [Proteobacteria bacterium]|nr:hypothetical protein [Pseudomonadota bacterium]